MTESIYDTSEEPNTLTPKLIYQSPTLFSELFPDPSIHPRASIRAASTGIVCILLFVSLFLGFIQERPSQLELIRKGQEWTQLDSLDVRLKKMEELEMEEGFRTSSVWAGEWDDTEKDGSSEKEDPTYSKAAIVKEQLLDGTISNYVWHESLESNTTFMTEGRLIVVGDIHGKHASLS